MRIVEKQARFVDEPAEIAKNPLEITKKPEETLRNAAELPPEPAKLGYFGLPTEKSVDISNYEGTAAEQGRPSRFSQHPRFVSRPVVRRRG